MAATRCCQSSSGETGGPSDRWTPAPGTGALPRGCSDRGNPSSTCRRGGGKSEDEMIHHRDKKKVCWERHLLSGDGSGLRVRIVDAFLDGLRQNGHVSGVVREHGEEVTSR